jgi:hypothetical protein
VTVTRTGAFIMLLLGIRGFKTSAGAGLGFSFQIVKNSSSFPF